jgi:hypothetical protein
MQNLRIFSAFVSPDAVYEHPPDLPTNPKELPEGPIEGWECYASVFGEFRCVRLKAEIKFEQTRDSGRVPFIRAAGSQFYFKEKGPAGHPCWYQSGFTLRFVREQQDAHDVATQPPKQLRKLLEDDT